MVKKIYEEEGGGELGEGSNEPDPDETDIIDEDTGNNKFVFQCN